MSEETQEYRRITVSLSRDEWIALTERARKDYRHPRAEARYLSRIILGLPIAPNPTPTPTDPQP